MLAIVMTDPHYDTQIYKEDYWSPNISQDIVVDPGQFRNTTHRVNILQVFFSEIYWQNLLSQSLIVANILTWGPLLLRFMPDQHACRIRSYLILV